MRSSSRKIYIILIVLLLMISIFSLSTGSVKIPKLGIVKYFLGMGGDLSESMKTILINVRLPRILMAVLIGMLLSSSGTVVQTVFQNPLADPYIIGIAASATFGAVLAFIFNLPDIMYGVLAFIISVIVSLVIFKLSKSGNRSEISTLLIIGIAISSFLGAFTSFAMYLIGENSFKIVTWMMGYLGSATWPKIVILLFPLIVSVLYFFVKRHELDLLLSGDEEAHALGVNVEKLKKRMLVVSSLIVGFSVAFTGMIGFVGLIVPHTIRLLTKSSSNTKLIPLASLGGGVFLLFCDTIGRTIIAPVEVPIGVVTSFFGAPFFLYLAMRSKKGG
jgi:iron complex transport system permease protein